MYQRTLDLTKQLVNISSPSGQENAILGFVASWLKDHDFIDVEQHALFTAGRVAGANARHALILCGHIDTVVAGDLVGWDTLPCQPVEKDGRLYGLGTSDMKAGLAAQMVVAEQLGHKDAPLDIWIAAVAGEETNGLGAKAFIEWFTDHTDYDRASCIIAEPTDLERVEIGHRGSSFVELTFSGTPGHASNQANYATSGLCLAQRFLDDVPTLVHALQQQFSDPTLGGPTLVPTVINAGNITSPNKTSDVARLVIDLRTTPQFDAVSNQWLDTVAQQYQATWRYPEPPTYAGLCDQNAAIVQAALTATGQKVPATSFGATDQFSFQAAGIDTVVFGPGKFACIHAQNEYIDLDTLRQAPALYESMIRHYARLQKSSVRL